MSIDAPGDAWDPRDISANAWSRTRVFLFIPAPFAGAASSKCFSSTGTPPGSSRHGRKKFFVHGIRNAGVNISLADQAKQRIRRLASRTFTRGVIGGIGSFGGLFALDKKWREPVLVSSADGVGTKLKIAAAMGIHSTVGGDLVNHCVNDILRLAPSRCFSSTIWRWARWTRTSSSSLSKGCRAPAIRPDAP